MPLMIRELLRCPSITYLPLSSNRQVHLLPPTPVIPCAVSREETEDAFESHMGSNHLGHFLLTMMLMPSLKRGAETAADGLGGSRCGRHGQAISMDLIQ